MANDEFPSIPAGTAVDHRALYEFGARHSIVVNEAQEAFSNWVGQWSSWQVDMEAGLLSLGERRVEIQFLGTHSFETDTWLWSWGNQAQ